MTKNDAVALGRSDMFEQPNAIVKNLRASFRASAEPPTRPPLRPQLSRSPSISCGQIGRAALLLFVGAAIFDGPAIMREGPAHALARVLMNGA